MKHYFVSLAPIFTCPDPRYGGKEDIRVKAVNLTMPKKRNLPPETTRTVRDGNCNCEKLRDFPTQFASTPELSV